MRYLLTPEDQAVGRRLAAREPSRRLWFWPGVTGAAVLGVAGFGAVGDGPVLGIVGAMVGGAAFWLACLAAQAWWLARPGPPGREVTLEAGPRGLRLGDGDLLSWTRVAMIREAPGQVVLVLDRGAPVVIPKSAIGGAQAVTAFLEACNGWGREAHGLDGKGGG
ncbi:MAG: hypothetical protein KAX56_06635 [Phenylobacterium sp.]|nr:hypothetical protein [Phenylobacterium sp.]